MPFPRRGQKFCPSGGAIYAGMSAPAPAGLPLWATKDVNEWVEIPGTAGADSNPLVDAWCGFCITDSGELLIPLAGGHTDGADTRVSSIMLTSNTPAWSRRKESLPAEMMNFSLQTWTPYSQSNPGPIYPYCKDELTPSSRHTRYTVQYCKPRNRIMLVCSPGLYGANGTSNETDGFSLDTNEWDPPGTWVSAANSSNRGTTTDDLGNIWCRGQKWMQATNSFVPMAGSWNYDIAAFDTTRRKLFMLSKGDNQGGSLNLGLHGKTLNEDGTTPVAITLTGSAYDEFAGLLLDYPAMEYDPLRDRFLYYWGRGITQGVVYVITPNSGTVWDISKLVQGANTSLPPLPPPAGVNARFKYIKVGDMDGVVLLPIWSSPIYFMRLG